MKNTGMIMKVDLEKAYDWIEWNFVADSLFDLVIPREMSRLIMSCSSSGHFKLLWNRMSTEVIEESRGLLQEDSPYLFVLCMEHLSHLILEEVEDNRWKPIKASRGGPNISHLMFANDHLFFAEASLDQIDIVKQCLAQFEWASGKKVNIA